MGFRERINSPSSPTLRLRTWRSGKSRPESAWFCVEPLAQNAIIDALDYITEKAGEGIAEKWLTGMLEAIDALETTPKANVV